MPSWHLCLFEVMTVVALHPKCKNLYHSARSAQLQVCDLAIRAALDRKHTGSGLLSLWFVFFFDYNSLCCPVSLLKKRFCIFQALLQPGCHRGSQAVTAELRKGTLLKTWILVAMSRIVRKSAELPKTCGASGKFARRYSVAQRLDGHRNGLVISPHSTTDLA